MMAHTHNPALQGRGKKIRRSESFLGYLVQGQPGRLKTLSLKQGWELSDRILTVRSKGIPPVLQNDSLGSVQI